MISNQILDLEGSDNRVSQVRESGGPPRSRAACLHPSNATPHTCWRTPEQDLPVAQNGRQLRFLVFLLLHIPCPACPSRLTLKHRRAGNLPANSRQKNAPHGTTTLLPTKQHAAQTRFCGTFFFSHATFARCTYHFLIRLLTKLPSKTILPYTLSFCAHGTPLPFCLHYPPHYTTTLTLFYAAHSKLPLLQVER